jgi:hypothetical protein
MIAVLMAVALFHMHAAQAGSPVDQFAGCQWEFGGLIGRLFAWAMICQ